MRRSLYLPVLFAMAQENVLGRLSSVTTTLPSGTLGTVSYTYDDAGNKATTTTPTGTTAYTYDPDNRLYQVIQNNTVLASYGYDKDGNRASLTRANCVTTGYTYDSIEAAANHEALDRGKAAFSRPCGTEALGFYWGSPNEVSLPLYFDVGSGTMIA